MKPLIRMINAIYSAFLNIYIPEVIWTFCFWLLTYTYLHTYYVLKYPLKFFSRNFGTLWAICELPRNKFSLSFQKLFREVVSNPYSWHRPFCHPLRIMRPSLVFLNSQQLMVKEAPFWWQLHPTTPITTSNVVHQDVLKWKN